MSRRLFCFAMVVFLAITMLSGFVSSQCAFASTLDPNSDLLIWANSQEYIDAIIAQFKKENPELNFNFKTEIQNQVDLTKKYQTSLAAGGEIPDILSGDCSMISKPLFKTLSDLSQAPFNCNTGDIIDWVAQCYTDDTGALRALEIGPAPSTFAIRRSVAVKYLGTDDIDQVYQQLSTWDQVIQVAQKIKSESGGKDFLASSPQELIGSLFYAVTEPPVDPQTKQIQIKAKFKDKIEILATLIQQGLVDSKSGPAVDQALTTDNYLLFEAQAWMPQWRFMATAENDANQFSLLPSTPNGVLYTVGGMPIGIPQKAANKEAAWAFLNWWRNTKNGCNFCTQNFGDLANVKACYPPADTTSMAASEKMKAYFGGQDTVKLFADNITKLSLKPFTAYDREWVYDPGASGSGSAILVIINKLQSGASVDEAIKAAEDLLVNAYPDLIAES